MSKYPASVVVTDFYKHQDRVIEWVKDSCHEYKILRVQDGFKIYFTQAEDYTALLIKFP